MGAYKIVASLLNVWVVRSILFDLRVKIKERRSNHARLHTSDASETAVEYLSIEGEKNAVQKRILLYIVFHMWNSLHSEDSRCMSVTISIWIFRHWGSYLGYVRHSLSVVDFGDLYWCGSALASKYEKVPQTWVSPATWEHLCPTCFRDFSSNCTHNLARRLFEKSLGWYKVFGVYWKTVW